MLILNKLKSIRMKKMENKSGRRSSLKKMGMAIVGAFGLGVVNAMAKESNPKKEVVGEIEQDQKIPLFSGAVKHGNTLYIAGKGAHFDGDIKSHTDHVLKELEKELVKNGSSMEQVLKVNLGFEPHKVTELIITIQVIQQQP